MTTPSELLDSLTGFEELAIEKATGRMLEDLIRQDRDIQLLRVANAVQFTRDDPKLKFSDAYKRAMELPQKSLRDAFESEPDDALPDEPDSEVGKDGSSADGRPSS